MLHRLIAKSWLTDDVFLLCCETEGVLFSPGQYLMAGPAGVGHLREYSIASAPGGGELRILVKRIDSGFVSPQLAELEPGDHVEIRAPFGEFLLPGQTRGRRMLLAATGTGIAPFTSFISAVPGLDYLLLHGVRYDAEGYLLDEFDETRVRRCVTRGKTGYRGRITDYFLDQLVDTESFDLIYACGNSDMIYELFHLARRAGYARHQLKAEIYY